MLKSTLNSFRYIYNELNYQLKRLFGYIPEDKNIVPACIIGGVQYYTFDNIFELPHERGLAALQIYEEFNSRITREQLVVALDSVSEMLNSNKLLDAHNLINNLKERCTWVIEAETLYKLASVLLFTKREDPYRYDVKYNKEKVKNWIKAKEYSFFLSTPLRNYIPSQISSPDDIKTCLVASLSKVRKMLLLAQKPYIHATSSVVSKQELELQLAKVESLLISIGQ